VELARRAMAIPRRVMFGSYDDRRHAYLLSSSPPDGPTRPSTAFYDDDGISAEEFLAAYLKRKRIDVQWYPPLSMERSHMLTHALARLRS
jgi:hypothetical protein